MVLPAVRDVVSNPYLSEMILSRLPTQDILRCMRVCRDWNGTIQSSLSLRRKLFLEPSKYEAKPVALRLFEHVRRGRRRRLKRSCWCGTQLYPPLELQDPGVVANGYVLNPLLFNPLEERHAGIVNLEASDVQLLDHPKAEGTSALHMFITQPPIQKVGIKLQGRLGEIAFSGDFALDIATGVTWADLVTAVDEVKRGKRQKPFKWSNGKMQSRGIDTPYHEDVDNPLSIAGYVLEITFNLENTTLISCEPHPDEGTLCGWCDLPFHHIVGKT